MAKKQIQVDLTTHRSKIYRVAPLPGTQPGRAQIFDHLETNMSAQGQWVEIRKAVTYTEDELLKVQGGWYAFKVADTGTIQSIHVSTRNVFEGWA